MFSDLRKSRSLIPLYTNLCQQRAPAVYMHGPKKADFCRWKNRQDVPILLPYSLLPRYDTSVTKLSNFWPMNGCVWNMNYCLRFSHNVKNEEKKTFREKAYCTETEDSLIKNKTYFTEKEGAEWWIMVFYFESINRNTFQFEYFQYTLYLAVYDTTI